MFRPTYVLTVASLLALAAGCSSKKNNPTVDAPGGNCSTVTYADPEFDSSNSDGSMFAGWDGAITGDLEGDGGTSQMQFEFYATSGVDLTQTIDLSQGIQADYATCAACLHLVSSSADGSTTTRQYFQDGGTIKLAMDPVTTQHLMLTATDVSLVEVMVGDMNATPPFHSTAVDGGKCISLGSFTLDRDATPAAWTCDHAAYNDGATCDCACGAHDPDCDLDAPAQHGCTATQVCGSADTCEDKCDVFSAPPVGCAAGNTCAVFSADADVCIASDDTRLDTGAAIGAPCTVATADSCGVVGGVATGFCDFFATDDETCRKACDADTDCTAVTQICEPIIGTKGVCQNKAANDTCQLATTLVINAAATTGSSAGASANYDAGLETTACTGGAQPGRDVAYKVTLTSGTAYSIKLTGVSPDYDPSLSVAGPGTAAAVCDAATITCLVGTDVGFAGEDETISAFTPTATGIYYIIVDTFSVHHTGTYSIQVTSP